MIGLVRFKRPFDTILNHTAKVKILRFFCLKGGVWSGNRIAAEISVNPMTAHRSLRELHQATLLNVRKIGNSLAYSLRDQHVLVRQILKPLFDREARLQDRLSELLSETLRGAGKSTVITVAVYGSVARGTERPTSDLDLLVLTESEQAKRQIQKALDRFRESVMEEFGNVPTLYVNTLSEARRKIRSKMPVFENILREHRVIFGRPLEETLRGKAA